MGASVLALYSSSDSFARSTEMNSLVSEDLIDVCCL